MLDKATFENQIKTLCDRELSEFIARQVYDISANCVVCKTDIKELQNSDRHATKIGAIAGIIVSAILNGVIILWKEIRG